MTSVDTNDKEYDVRTITDAKDVDYKVKYPTWQKVIGQKSDDVGEMNKSLHDHTSERLTTRELSIVLTLIHQVIWMKTRRQTPFQSSLHSAHNNHLAIK